MKDLIIDKKFKGLIQKDNGDYFYDGSIEHDENIIIDLDDRFIISGSIEAETYIEAGDEYGIFAGLQITCKGCLTYGLKCFAGICTWREISDEEKTITCGRYCGGTIEYGILKETVMNKTHTISINGKDIEISEDSYKKLKESFV